MDIIENRIIEKKLEKYWFDNGFINENCKFKNLSKEKPKDDDVVLFIENFKGVIVDEFIGTNQSIKIFKEKSRFTHWILLPLNTIK